LGLLQLSAGVFVVQFRGTLMNQPRRHVRVRPSGLVSGHASLIVAPRKPVIPCMVIDYSAGGACVELNADASLPPRIEILHGAVKKRCRVVWKRGRRVGLCF
jgi:hypothetical protein